MQCGPMAEENRQAMRREDGIMSSPSAGVGEEGEEGTFESAVDSNIEVFVGFVGFVGFLAIGCPGLGHSRKVACRQRKEGKSQATIDYLLRNAIPLKFFPLRVR